MESLSGPGSTKERTKTVIKIVCSTIRQYKINSVLDIPCGDFNWTKSVDLKNVSYHGADMVDELIEVNRRIYGGTGRTFTAIDLSTDEPPDADLVICRDCLVHFSIKSIRFAVANIKRSGATYLLMTTFPGAKNRNITASDWFMLIFRRLRFTLLDWFNCLKEVIVRTNALFTKNRWIFGK